MLRTCCVSLRNNLFVFAGPWGGRYSRFAPTLLYHASFFQDSERLVVTTYQSTWGFHLKCPLSGTGLDWSFHDHPGLQNNMAPGPARTCMDVRPLPGQSGLSCGGDSQQGARLANEDRTIATDLQDLKWTWGSWGSGHAGHRRILRVSTDSVLQWREMARERAWGLGKNRCEERAESLVGLTLMH